MRLLLLSNSYLPNLGGLQTVTHSLATGLAAQGYTVKVITNRYPRKLATRDCIDGIDIQRLLFLIPRWRDVQRKRFDLFLAAWVYFPLTLLQLMWAIVRFRPDVVNLHFVGGAAFFAALLQSLLRFPLVVSLHGDDVEGLARGTSFDRAVFESAIRHAAAVTACSSYLLKKAQAYAPDIRDRGHVIYNGLGKFAHGSDSESYTTRQNGHQILRLTAVGRLVRKKGFDVLLDALGQDSNLVWKLCLIGDGPVMHELRALAVRLKISDSIQFQGKQNQEYVQRAMLASDLVIIPSRQEPFGMVALEAMAAGKPVIASNVGGLPEVLQDADALFVPPDDAVALARAIGILRTILQEQPHFGARNRELAQNFSRERMVSKYLQVFHQVSEISV